MKLILRFIASIYLNEQDQDEKKMFFDPWTRTVNEITLYILYFCLIVLGLNVKLVLENTTKASFVLTGTVILLLLARYLTNNERFKAKILKESQVIKPFNKLVLNIVFIVVIILIVVSTYIGAKIL